MRLIDAVFGVGLSREIEGDYRLCIEAMNALTPAPSLRAAVDIPSGIHADTGQVMGIAFRADVTAAFGWEKQGTVLYPGREYAGSVQVEDIGFPAAAIDCAPGSEGCSQPAFTYGPEDLAQVQSERLTPTRGPLAECSLQLDPGACAGPLISAPWGLTALGPGWLKFLLLRKTARSFRDFCRRPSCLSTVRRMWRATGRNFGNLWRSRPHGRM